MTPEERIGLVRYRLDKATKTLHQAEKAMEMEDWNLAVNRFYYACFYASSALLIQRDIESKKHSDVKRMLGLHFVATGLLSNRLSNFYTKLFSLRQSGDYEDYCNFEKEDVTELMQPATEFIEVIKSLIILD